MPYSGTIGPRGSDPTLGEGCVVGGVNDWSAFKEAVSGYIQAIFGSQSDPTPAQLWGIPIRIYRPQPGGGPFQTYLHACVSDEGELVLIKMQDAPEWFENDEEYLFELGHAEN